MTSSLYSRDSRTEKICSRLMNEWEEYYVSVIIPLFRFQCLFRVSVISCSSKTFIWYLTDFGRSIPLLMLKRERGRFKGIINNQTKGCSWFPWNLLGVLVIASPQRLLPPASLSTQSLVPDSHSEKDEDWLKKCSMKRIQCSFSSRMISLSLSRSCGCGFDSWSKPKDGNERWRRGRARTRKDSNNLCIPHFMMVVAHVVVWVSWFRQKRIVFLLHRHGHHHRDVREKRVFCLVFYAFFLAHFFTIFDPDADFPWLPFITCTFGVKKLHYQLELQEEKHPSISSPLHQCLCSTFIVIIMM